MTIALLDPSIASANLGDEIIREAVTAELAALWPAEQIIHLPTQEIVGARSARLARAARHRIVGGTNLLSSHMARYRQWQIGWRDAGRIGPAILLGVGWWQYQPAPDLYTRAVLRRVLAGDALHAVRDGYTLARLRALGLQALNTACPTMWRLTPDHCAAIPAARAEEVVVTLTDYHPAPAQDRALLDLLAGRYRRVLFWPQGSGDLAYARALDRLDRVEVIGPTLAAFDRALAAVGRDYVGTRLHAGVRALQHRRRALILAVDNRSPEIARDTGLPVIDRNDLPGIAAHVDGARPTIIRLPTPAIAQWRRQFAERAASPDPAAADQAVASASRYTSA